MAHIETMSLINTIHGKTCHHDDTYTKRNKQTGRVYAVKVCNPYEGDASPLQLKQRSFFGMMQSAISAWVTTEKAANDGNGSVAYNKALAAFRSQHRYGSLRGMIMAKHAVLDPETKQVTIAIGNLVSTIDVADSIVVTPSNPGGSGTGSSDQGGSEGGGNQSTQPEF